MIESHSILGLSFAVLIYVVSLTGAFTVFAPEIALWEARGLPTADSAAPAQYEAALAEALAQKRAGHDPQALVAIAPGQFQRALVVRLNERGTNNALAQTNWVADPADGKLVGELHSPLADLIEELHVALHLPAPWGRYLVGLLGVCMFCLMISGILAHPSIFRDAFKLRVDRSRRMAWTDVHNRLSVWGLPFHLVITFTGGFLGIAGLIIGAMAFVAYDGDQEAALRSISGPQPVEGEALTSLPPVAAVLRDAALRSGGLPLELVVVNDPANSGGTLQVSLLDPGLLDARISYTYRNTGEFLGRSGGEEAPGGIRALAMVQPLHYGTFGGYVMKGIYFLLALALTWMTSSGMQIWFHRRAQQGRPVAGYRAAWEGMTGGLSVGLALACLLAVAGFGNLCLAALLLAWGLTIVARVAFPSAPYRSLVLVVGSLLAMAFGLRLASREMVDLFQIQIQIVNGILALLIAGCVFVALKPRRCPSRASALEPRSGFP